MIDNLYRQCIEDAAIVIERGATGTLYQIADRLYNHRLRELDKEREKTREHHLPKTQ